MFNFYETKIVKVNLQQRRGFMAGLAAGGMGALALSACGGSATANASATSQALPIVILVHGSWHSSFCWARVLPLLTARGVRPLPIDLPGTGLNGRFPASWYARPFDPTAYADEVSPLAATTLADYSNTVGSVIDALHAAGQGPIYVLGHSLGGATVNAVAESRAAKLAGVLYLSALLPLPNQSLLNTIARPSLATSRVVQGLAGAIAAGPDVQAARIDSNSPDPVVRAVTQATYCADVSEDDFLAWLNLLVPDDPTDLYATAIPLTAAGYGSLKRGYIKCTADEAVVPAAADDMIAAMDASGIGGKTIVQEINSSHCAFLSQPAALASAIVNFVS